MNVVEARRFVRRRQRASRTSDNDSFGLGGGLNLVDPPAIIRPGYVLAAENYEMGLEGGYERLGGFERFDGREAPSAQTYYLIPFRYSSATEAMKAVGATITAGGVSETFEVISANFTTVGGQTYSQSRFPVAFPADVVPPQRTTVVPLGGIATTAPNKHLAPPSVGEFLESSLNQIQGSVCLSFGAISPDIVIGEAATVSFFCRQRDSVRRYMKVVLDGTYSGFNNTTVEAVIDLQERVIDSSVGAVTWSIEDFEYGNGWMRVVAQTPVATIEHASFRLSFGLLDENEETTGNGALTTHVGNPLVGVYVGGCNADKAVGAAPDLTPYREGELFNNPSQAYPTGVGYFLARSLSDTLNQAPLTQGTLTDSEGTVFGEWSGSEWVNGAITLPEHLAALKYVANLQRELVETVPGGGPIRGVWFYRGVVYAFRDDAASSATETRVYKSSAAGWVQVALAPYIDFDAGQPAGAAGVVLGATIVGGTSGAQATIERINLINDDWAGGNAAGRLILSGITGGPFQNNEDLEISATLVATADGANVAPTLSPGGTYRFRNYNFYGSSDLFRMYGVSGVDNFFEYDDDDEIFALYRTGMALDTPTHLGVHLYHLFLGFPGGSVQNSGTGRPAVWTVITGAAELGVGDDITDFIEEVSDTLFIFTRNQSYQLNGRTTATFALNRFDARNGAIENSVQRIGMGIHLDDRGFSNLSTSDRFGNYRSNTFSRLVHKLLTKVMKAATVTASVIYRTGNRYRCFFSDGRFFSIGVAGGGNVSGIMLCDYGLPIRCACSEEDTDGTERIFYGSDDGYIYEAEKGTSFDGKPIRAGLRLPWHHSGRPDRVKHYREGRIEAILDGQATLYCRASLGFGAIHRPELDISAEVGGAIWDHTMEWEGFIWDQLIEPLKNFRINGDGTNISLQLRHESDVERPHTLRAVVYQTSMRGIKRGARVG